MRIHDPDCPIQEPKILAGPQTCSTCRAIRSVRYETAKMLLDKWAEGCGDPDCGCDLVVTDCCEEPRWNCQTGVVFDSAGDPDVRLCRDGFGCNDLDAWERARALYGHNLAEAAATMENYYY